MAAADTTKYSYLLVIDFEATCDEDKSFGPQEIIEFPCVAVDVATRAVVAEFHAYVRPTHRPVLSNFCTELTGIEQATVDAAAPFEDVLELFRSWLVEHGLSTTNALACTCGDWDLNSMLPRQCELLASLSNADVPAVLKSWCNVKHAFEQVCHHRAGGMASMLSSLELDLQGRHHSGIDDARNIARIVVKLIDAHGWCPAPTKSREVAASRGGRGRGRGRGSRGRGDELAAPAPGTARGMRPKGWARKHPA